MMKRNLFVLFLFLFMIDLSGYAQTNKYNFKGTVSTGSEINWLSSNFDDRIINTWYTDLGMEASNTYQSKYQYGLDLKYRLGAEFGEPKNYLRINESWGGYNFGRYSIAAGKRIVDWGGNLEGFDNHILNPVDHLYRTTEQNDRNLGVLFASLTLRPVSGLSIELLLSPAYTPSVLPLRAAGIPDFVTIENPENKILMAARPSGGIDIRFSSGRTDGGLSFYHGYDPMPLLIINSAFIDTTGGIIRPSINIDQQPFKVNIIAFNSEIQAGSIIVRTAAAWIGPVGTDNSTNPLSPESSLSGGLEVNIYGTGIIIEYGFRHLFNFTPTQYDPSFPKTIPEVPPEYIPVIMAGFRDNIEGILGSFNRLMRYQLKENYHSVTSVVTRNFLRETLSASLAWQYNFSSGELFFSPSLRYSAADGVAFSLGASIYQGREGTMFDMIRPALTSVYAGLHFSL